MTLADINAFIAKQFEDGSGIFGTVVTATELILGSELAEQIKQIQGNDNTPPALKKTAQAVKNAEKRYKFLTAILAGSARSICHLSFEVISEKVTRRRSY